MLSSIAFALLYTYHVVYLMLLNVADTQLYGVEPCLEGYRHAAGKTSLPYLVREALRFLNLWLNHTQRCAMRLRIIG